MVCISCIAVPLLMLLWSFLKSLYERFVGKPAAAKTDDTAKLSATAADTADSAQSAPTTLRQRVDVLAAGQVGSQ